jgi:hypothetical protein
MRMRGRGIRRSGTVIWNAVLLAALLLAGRPTGAFAAAPEPAAVPSAETVDNIARAPELYDGRLLSVTGTISDLGTIVDDWGQQYLVFRLMDGYRSIVVLVGGQAADLRTGLRVQVTGVFYGEAVASGARLIGVLRAFEITGSR